MPNRIMISVPSASWDGFKADIMTTWFAGSPMITRHLALASDDREFATFFSDCPEDIETAISKIPAGGVALFV